MKPFNMREKTLAAAMGLALALAAPALCGDDKEKTRTPATNAGHTASPPPRQSSPPPSTNHQAPARTNSAPAQNNPPAGGRTYTPPARQVTPPAQNNPGGNSTYTPQGRNQPGNGPQTRTPSNQPGGGTQTTNTPAYNPGGRTPNTPGNSPSINRAPNNGGYNPSGNRTPNNVGNTPSGNTPGGNRTPNTGGYNPSGNRTPNNVGNTPGGNTPGGNRTPNTGGYNPGGNRNPNNNGYNPGGNRQPNNSGGSNQGGRTFRPPQGAMASTRQGGGTVYTHGNAQYHTDNSGRLTHYSRPGADARFASNGRVSYAQVTRADRSTVSVNRGPRGERTVVTVRADRTRVVSYGPRYGYVERPLMARPGYVSRTYVYGGRPYVHVYASYGWRGMTYYRYVPPVYYNPGFYGWAFNPWARPVYFRWGWYRDPWYDYWGGYFTPAPVYATASLWLTDYLLAENLRLAYESRQAAMQQGQDPPPQEYPQNSAVTLTPEVKAAIAEEVRQQIEAERAASAGQSGGYPGTPQGGTQGGYPGTTAPTSGDAPPPSLDPKQRIFVVSTSLDVTSAGQNCALTPGDIIIRTSDQMTNDGRIGVSVLSSKPGDCAVNAGAEIEVAALQEMHNQFREQIDSGLKTLADNQGKGGLPPAPASNPRTVAEGQAPPDNASSVQDALARQQTDANQAEAEVQQAANTGQ